MKNANFVFYIIMILSAVAGVVAFKSQKFLGTWYCSTKVSINCPTATTRNDITTTTCYCTKVYSFACTYTTHCGLTN
jgi:hypothetical protein